MTNADHERADWLSDFLDARAKGDDLPADADPATTQAVRRFFASDDAPPPPHDLTRQIWEELMYQPTVTASAFPSTIPLTPRIGLPPNRNGRVPKADSRHDSSPGLPEAYVRRPWLARGAGLALLVLTLALGYVAFGPIRLGPDRPSSGPAVLAPATPATEESTPEAPIAQADHAIVGVWEQDRANEVTLHNYSYTIFSEDGTYVAYDKSFGVSIGSWRATDERTVEVVFVTQQVDTQELFDPDQVPAGTEFAPGRFVWRLVLTLDEGGATMTSIGGYESVGDDGEPTRSEGPWTMEWARVGPVTSGDSGTPAP